jgi:hypothetical protein
MTVHKTNIYISYHNHLRDAAVLNALKHLDTCKNGKNVSVLIRWTGNISEFRATSSNRVRRHGDWYLPLLGIAGQLARTALQANDQAALDNVFESTCV